MRELIKNIIYYSNPKHFQSELYRLSNDDGFVEYDAVTDLVRHAIDVLEDTTKQLEFQHDQALEIIDVFEDFLKHQKINYLIVPENANTLEYIKENSVFYYKSNKKILIVFDDSSDYVYFKMRYL